jgi:hypothetical protein
MFRPMWSPSGSEGQPSSYLMGTGVDFRGDEATRDETDLSHP